jgi:hypothetical protein
MTLSAPCPSAPFDCSIFYFPIGVVADLPSDNLLMDNVRNQHEPMLLCPSTIANGSVVILHGNRKANVLSSDASRHMA